MNDDELIFDIEDVHRLVDKVVDGLYSGQTIHSSPQDPKRFTTATKTVPFGIYDTVLLSELHESLSKLQIHDADIQMVLDNLRDRLLRDVKLGSIQDLHSLTINCKRCPALSGAKLPIGNLVDPDLVLVSDYPVDDWPQDLLEYMKEIGLSTSRTMLTFATRCSTSGRLAVEEEIKNCSHYLYSEIQLLAPKLIVTLGSTCSSLFLDPLKISEEHGIIYWSGPWAIMPVYSLGYLKRKDSADKEFMVDLTKAKNFLYGI